MSKVTFHEESPFHLGNVRQAELKFAQTISLNGINKNSSNRFYISDFVLDSLSSALRTKTSYIELDSLNIKHPVLFYLFSIDNTNFQFISVRTGSLQNKIWLIHVWLEFYKN